MFAKLNSLFDREMRVYYVTQMLKQVINIKQYVLDTYSKFRNTN